MKNTQCIGKHCYEVLCRQEAITEENCFCYILAKIGGKQQYHNEESDCYYDIEAKEVNWLGINSYVFYMDDVTEKVKQKNLELLQKGILYNRSKENENRLENAIHFANLMVYDYDPEERKFFNDNGWIKEMGLTSYMYNIPESFIESGVIEPASIPVFMELFSEIETGKELINKVIWLRLPPDSHRVCLKISSQVVKDENGIPILVHGIGQDITEQRNAEEAYEHRINSIFQMNPDAVLTLQVNLPIATQDMIEHNNKDSRLLSIDDIHFNHIKILLCEDNKINQEIAKRLLERAGAVVDIAENGRIGVEQFAASKIDEYSVILMDIRMPELDGLSATKQIRALTRQDAKAVPIIAMTANALQEEKQECLDSGMTEYLMKPIDMMQMYTVITEALNHRSS